MNSLKPSKLELLNLLESEYNIRLNIVTQQIEIVGIDVEIELMYLVLLDEHGIEANKHLVLDMVRFLAWQNEYNPIGDIT